ncbi:hypothetical protein [Crocinitomix catalasitica]|uniref:hypothetical protein n=1 Tax=Crocinitomix catalasitica TaxID=184607 RepID=UPI000482ABE6|nr:hypothetical protein [Crocinitomix catalasitica]
MNQFIKLIILLSIFFVSSSINAQGFYITYEGDTVKCKDVSISGQYFYAEGMDGKSIKLPQKKIKEFRMGNRLYYGLNISSKMKRLQEVFAFNDKYVLTGYWQGENTYFYIWPKDALNQGFNPVERKILMLGSSTEFEKWHPRARKIISERIGPYFGECTELMDLFESNISNSNNITNSIAVVNCE